MAEEHRARSILYRNLVSVPHRNYGPMVSELGLALKEDPDFASRALVYIAQTSKIRDQVDASIIALLQADTAWPEYREAGRCLVLGSDVYDIRPNDISGLQPFRIFRIVEYMASPFIVGSTQKAGEELGRFISAKQARIGEEKLARKLGLDLDSMFFTRDPDHRLASRQTRGIVEDYFAMLERNPVRAEGVVVGSRKAVQRLVKRYRMSDEHFPYIRSLLSSKPPEGSKLAILKAVASEENHVEQARLAMEAVTKHKIPYRIMTSVLPKLSPAVGIVLIQSMSPNEARNSRRWVEESGLLEMPEVKDVYLAKVAQATDSVASLDHRKSAMGQDQDVEAAKQAAKQASVDKEARIERATGLMIDMSDSMGQALVEATRFGERVAPLCDDLMTVLFNAYARHVAPRENTLAGWQQALRGVRPSGMTSMEAGFDLMLKSGFEPDQLVIITDEGENVGRTGGIGSLAQAIRESGLSPHIVILALGRGKAEFPQSLENAGLRVDRFLIKPGDYYAYDQVTQLLGGPAALGIVEQILSIELPWRVQNGQGYAV